MYIEINVTMARVELELLDDTIKRFGFDEAISKWADIIRNKVNDEIEEKTRKLYKELKEQ